MNSSSNNNMLSSSSSSSSSAYQKKAVHTLLASRLTQLHIPSAAADDPSQDFDFSDLFGPAAAPSPTSASSLFLGDPQVIHHRSHSFVGPSPRFTLSKSLPKFDRDERDELYYSSSDDTGGDDARERAIGAGGGVAEDGGDEVAEKVGPGDFEIMRVIGKGAFGKVFQVRRKGKSEGDGIFAMKVRAMGFSGFSTR